MHVLVTGSSGAVGRQVCRELSRQGDTVRGFDCERHDEPLELYLGDIAEPAHLAPAMSGIDAVIHLAANPHDAPFPELVAPNVMGVYNVLEAARAAGVKRVVLASSVQAAGGHKERRLSAEHRAPNNHYAVTKVLAEEMGALYARRFGLDVISARVGWMVRNASEAARMRELRLFHIYVSGADAAHFFHAAVHAEFHGYATLWAIGRDGRERYDLESAERVIGYRPQHAWPEGAPA
ncbi:MAG: NAD(P)-dependent oxidoreductase [Polyangiaceae bacterium]